MNDDIPDEVVAEWLKLCKCCGYCGSYRPCDGVMSGGFCDRVCTCGNEDNEDG